MEDIVQQLQQRSDRVREHSASSVNDRIALTTQAAIDRSVASGRDAIVSRLAELDREWDIDRVLMANFAVVGGAAYAAGLYRYTRPSWPGQRRVGFLGFFGVQLAFMLVHATAGWCPPLVLWRRLGFRTRVEIETERHILCKHLDQRPAGVEQGVRAK